jgi:hypothetical protein
MCSVGISLFNEGEYKESVEALQEAIDIAEEDVESARPHEPVEHAAGHSEAPSLRLKFEDVERIKIYLGKANSKLMFQKRAEAMHKKKLQNVFNRAGAQQGTSQLSKTEGSDASGPETPTTAAGDVVVANGRWFQTLIANVANVAMYVFGGSRRHKSNN